MWLPGPLSPRAHELLSTRRDDFDELVLSLVDRLTGRLGAELADVEFGTEDVPQVADDWTEPVPLGSLLPATRDTAARIVIFRRPIEVRAKTRVERVLLVHQQLVHHVAELLGRDPAELDRLGGLGDLDG
jgi:Zincin-like metallopeptidase